MSICNGFILELSHYYMGIASTILFHRHVCVCHCQRVISCTLYIVHVMMNCIQYILHLNLMLSIFSCKKDSVRNMEKISTSTVQTINHLQ